LKVLKSDTGESSFGFFTETYFKTLNVIKMKKISAVLMIATALSICAIMALPVQTSGKPVSKTTITELPGLPSDTTVTVTITKIVLSSNSITLKDGSGKLWNFTVDPQLIDLRRFKVGQSLTATISNTWFTDKVTRARITKTQLIKLQ
jgi:hypothetical protein